MTDHVRIKNYQDALAYLGNKKERPIAHNTRIEIDSLDLGHEVITVKYHGNPIVNLYPDGTVTLDSCGWKTTTTKERLNWFIPDGFVLYQEKSAWWLVNRSWNDATGWTEDHRYLFTDGIAFKNGQVYNAGDESDFQETQKTLKAIKKYVSGYVKALISGNVPVPDSGDCWYCHMVTDDGKSLGDATGNTGHIESHLEESYYVPSLLVNAEKANHRMCAITKDGIARLWQGESLDGHEWQKSIIVRDVSSCLTAYLKQKLGIAQ